MEIFKEFIIDCAHSLPHVPEGHKCKNVHGHTYKIKVVVDGPLDEKMGWVMDFSDIKEAFLPIKDTLDHKYLNDIPGLENPTAEVICIWIYDKIKPKIPLLKEVWVFETPTSGCVHRG